MKNLKFKVCEEKHEVHVLASTQFSFEACDNIRLDTKRVIRILENEHNYQSADLKILSAGYISNLDTEKPQFLSSEWCFSLPKTSFKEEKFDTLNREVSTYIQNKIGEDEYLKSRSLSFATMLQKNLFSIEEVKNVLDNLNEEHPRTKKGYKGRYYLSDALELLKFLDEIKEKRAKQKDSLLFKPKPKKIQHQQRNKTAPRSTTRPSSKKRSSTKKLSKLNIQ